MQNYFQIEKSKFYLKILPFDMMLLLKNQTFTINPGIQLFPLPCLRTVPNRTLINFEDRFVTEWQQV